MTKEQTNSWIEELQKLLGDNDNWEINEAYSFDTNLLAPFISKIISQEKEKWEKERSEEDNYQCVDCSEWNVKSPLTQCSECRRQD